MGDNITEQEEWKRCFGELKEQAEDEIKRLFKECKILGSLQGAQYNKSGES